MCSAIISSHQRCSSVKGIGFPPSRDDGCCCAIHALKLAVTRLGVGHQFVVLVHRVAHQRHEVGEDAAAARAFDLALVQRGVGLPELAFGPQVRRGLQRVGQRLQVVELQRRLGRAVVEDLQRGDLVLVLRR